MIGRRFLLLFLLTTLLALATSPLLAQGAPTLPQTSQAMDAGLILSVSYPEGWVADASAQGILIGSSQSALDELNKTGLVSKPGDVGVIVSLPNFLDNLSLPHNAAAADALKAYLQAGKITGAAITPSTDFSVPAATVVVTPPGQGGKAVLGALEFPNGTVIIGIVPDTAFDATVMAIFNSITLEALPDLPAVTPDSSVSLATPASFNYLQPGASVTLSLGVPAGWASQYSDGAGVLYLGNSDAALQKASASGVTFAPGDVAVTVALPHAVIGLGIPANSTPDDAISKFQTQTKALGRVVTDTTFGVPAAHAHLTGGNLPDGGGDVYAMKFDQGLVFIVVQPAGVIDGTIAAILQSIHLSELAAPPVATQEATAQTTAQSTGKTVTIPVTQPNGAFELSFDVPDGWSEAVSSGGTAVNMGSSAAALQKISNSQGGYAAGDIGLTIGYPELLTQMGINFKATPQDVANSFITLTKSKGTVTEDDSFGVPAVHAQITGDNIPDGAADVYALSFEGGTLLVAVQPAGAINDTVITLIKSIKFSPASGTTAPATPVIEATAAPSATTAPVTSAHSIEQWASAATGTSEYSDSDWSYAQMTGEPNTTTCGDSGTAWASADSTGRAVVQLTFAQAVIPSQINVYQTFNPGAIVEIDVGNSSNPNKVLPLPHSVDAPGNTACPGVFSLDVSGVDVPIDFVVIYIDQSKTQNWDEIDAVQLVGTPAS